MHARIGIVGFGFAGLMVTANLVRMAQPHTVIYVVAEDLRGIGLAYGTENPAHLLNVPAGRMGAFAEDVGGFCTWLASADAAPHKQRLGITTDDQATDFVPRALYGAYLQSIWRETQQLAVNRQIQLKLVESSAIRIAPLPDLAMHTARGDAIAVDRVVLATGNEAKPIFPHVNHPHVIQNPWEQGVFDTAAQWADPVLLFGAGLTAVDMWLSLRAHGYPGQVMMVSRSGHVPHMHRVNAASALPFEMPPHAVSLRQLLVQLRARAQQGEDWRAVVDGLRPHTSALWQALSATDQQRFFARLSTFWNIHRHRMAPSIGRQLTAELAAGTVHAFACRHLQPQSHGDGLRVAFAPGGEMRPVARLINCTGGQLTLAGSRRAVLRQALAEGVVETHATGIGLSADPQCRVWGTAYPSLYAIGGLLTGQRLESTAVPELRTQAAAIANKILG